MKNILKILLFSISSFVLSDMTKASENLKIQTDIGQQKTFLKAEKLLALSYSQQYKSLYNQLYYYPLQPYLDQRRLMETMQISSAGEISIFLDKYQNSPLDWPLRKAWLKYLAKKNKGTLFLEFYKSTSNTVLSCQQLRFSLKAGAPKNVVLPQVTKLWVVGKSLDKVCDPIIKQWQQAGYRTNEVIWQRIGLAANGGKHTLIPYLTQMLPKKQQYLGRLWHQVRRDPATVVKQYKFINKSAKESQIYTYGIKRLVWRDPNKALASYKKAQQLFNFTTAQKQQITAKFAVALASKNHDKARIWLEKLDPINVERSIMQWQLTEVLKQQDWQQVLKELAKMPTKYKTELQWLYWYARALIGTNELERGQDVMSELAGKRHYYGFLAASYLETPVSLQNSPLAISGKEKNSILLHASAKRAFEFYYLGRFVEARREWRYWLSQLSNREKLVAAKLANENGWFDRAIFTLSQVGYLDDVELRFPKAFDKKINQHAKKQAINPAWAFAIARRESSFMTDAHSSVGARGLMQLMPNTAKQLKRGSVSRQYLYNAENNIKLGTKYLRRLLDKNKGNQILATASYNAGPYRVKKWLQNTSAMPADIWIETIPFKETRNYVKSVLAYQEIYQHKPGQVSRIFEQVINMNIGE
ncbi:lytic transglycosylase domain-containing protein [Colwellia psychrerythraea]|uniref:Lytic transglycosylase catalytic n=1 Tax=Colwellia psychrerythraea TaxID=28229 RepID=A0A099L176_COLPS|nr:lytic transglycosylase domain-containing protein [Colwellia psychrerythraea]KGJ96734.1 Lytic transglycosylase catalytic [Colwellia psychrerythraea]